ncbi:MAG: M66 family metalloprotease [Minicystis sp.]
MGSRARRSVGAVLSLLSVVLSVGCGSSETPGNSGHAPGTGGGTGAGGSGGKGGAGGKGSPEESALPASYGYKTFEFPEPADDAPCTGAKNDSAAIAHVYFAQTHVMEPSWPLFFLVAKRPALIKVDVTGSGAAPEVKVEGWLGDVPLGVKCLKGPANLPMSVSAAEQRRDDSFTATLPKAWLQPGLRIKVTAGGAERAFSDQELAVGPAPEFNLAILDMDVLNYNEGHPDVPEPADFLRNLASEIPAAELRVGHFPARIRLPRLVVGGDAGTTPTVLEKRLCSDGDPNPATCTPKVAGMDDLTVSAATLRLVDALHDATGDFAFSFYFGNTERLAPGGWGGNKTFVSFDFTDVTIHELGHALSLPHWGEGWYKPADPVAQGYSYPYGGVKDDGGGRGDTWSYDQVISAFVSPICQDPSNKDVFEQERGDAMYRSMSCLEYKNGAAGPWDGFSDFSALAIFRDMAGASAVLEGEVPYSRVGKAAFWMPDTPGFPTLTLDDDGKRVLRRSTPLDPLPSWEKMPFLVPQQWDVPVYTLYGSYHPQFDEARIIYDPLEYQGNLPALVDPTDPATFAELQKGGEGKYEDFFWWPKDLTFKFLFEDGTFQHALYTNGSFDRDQNLGTGPWRGDLVYWAITIPHNKKLKRVEIYERPFLVRYPGDADAGNINNPALGITAANFMNDAKLVASKDF